MPQIGLTEYDELDVVTPAPRLLAEGPASVPSASGRGVLQHVSAHPRCSVREVARALADRYGIDDERALADTAAFLRQAQLAGLVSLRGARCTSGLLAARYSLWRLQFAFGGGRAALSTPVRRVHRPATVANVLLSVVRAHVPLAVALCVGLLGLLHLVAGGPVRAWDGGDVRLAAVAVTVQVVLLLVVSAAHEAAHLVVARWCSMRVHSVYEDGVAVGLHRDVGGRGTSALISVAGPVVGAAVVLLVAAALRAGWGHLDLTRGGAAVVVVVVVVVLLVQLASLVPPSADGAALLSSSRRGRAADDLGLVP